MNRGLTELVMILDRSGSMRGLEKDTIGGYNAMLDRQRKEEGRVLVTTILFDDRDEMLHDRTPIDQVGSLTDRDYYVRGCTALMDALGTAIERISLIQDHVREEDRPDKTIFIITTDGMENASRRFRASRIRQMVREREAAGWEFIFLGANIDAVAEAARYGIPEDRAANYHADEAGTRLNFEVLSEAVCEMRRRPAGSPRMNAAWKARIDEDYESRSKGEEGQDGE